MQSETRENLGPADELGAVREKLRVLRAHEEGLRDYLIAHPEARHGKNFVAELTTATRRTVDWQLLEEEYPAVLSDLRDNMVIYDKPTDVLRLVGISEGGEPISLAKMRKLQEQEKVT